MMDLERLHAWNIQYPSDGLLIFPCSKILKLTVPVYDHTLKDYLQHN